MSLSNQILPGNRGIKELPFRSPYTNHCYVHLPRWIIDDISTRRARYTSERTYMQLYILDYIAKHQNSSHKTTDWRKNKNGFVTVSQKATGEILGIPQNTVKTILIDFRKKGYIEIDNSQKYIPGIQSYAYKVIGDNYILCNAEVSGTKQFNINLSSIGKQIKIRSKALSMDLISALYELKQQHDHINEISQPKTNNNNTKLSIYYRSTYSKQIIVGVPDVLSVSVISWDMESLLDWGELLSYSAELSRAGIKEKLPLGDNVDLGQRLYYNVRSMFDFFHGQWWASESIKTGRYYSLEINLHRPFRNLLYHEDFGELAHPDLANSQVVCLLVHMYQQGFEPSPGFVDSILEGTHYDYSIEQLQYKGGRDSYKTGYFEEVLFAQIPVMDRCGDEIAKLFKALYPLEYRWIRNEKKRVGYNRFKDQKMATKYGHKVFNWKISIIESDWMIRTTIPFMYSNQMWAHPVHDGILCLSNEKLKVKKIMENTFFQKYNLKPKIK